METTICIDDKNILKKSYKLRPTGKRGSTIETSIPREVFEREARRFGLNPEEVLTKESQSRPYAATGYGEEEQVKSLSQALKEMMRKELLNGKEA